MDRRLETFANFRTKLGFERTYQKANMMLETSFYIQTDYHYASRNSTVLFDWNHNSSIAPNYLFLHITVSPSKNFRSFRQFTARNIGSDFRLRLSSAVENIHYYIRDLSLSFSTEKRVLQLRQPPKIQANQNYPVHRSYVMTASSPRQLRRQTKYTFR